MSRNGEFDEPRYIISVAAKLVDLHPQTLRHYESIGLLNPGRSDGNIRLYSQRDIERLRKISRLTDDLGVNLAGVEIILHMGERMEALQNRLDQAEEAMRSDRERLRAQVRRDFLDAIHRHAADLSSELQRVVAEIEKQLD
jgi:MerR family transcriptional regulator/heat shock protein HspR